MKDEKVSLTGRIEDPVQAVIYISSIWFKSPKKFNWSWGKRISPSRLQSARDVQKGDIMATCGYQDDLKAVSWVVNWMNFVSLRLVLLNLPDDKVGIKILIYDATKRHLDLIANPDSYSVFRTRSKIISALRSF